jgi:carbon storage regulator
MAAICPTAQRRPMLVLTRSIGQEILIGDDIVIRLVAINGTQVRIGIEAPRHVAVDRREVRAAKDAEGH